VAWSVRAMHKSDYTCCGSAKRFDEAFVSLFMNKIGNIMKGVLWEHESDMNL